MNLWRHAYALNALTATLAYDGTAAESAADRERIAGLLEAANLLSGALLAMAEPFNEHLTGAALAELHTLAAARDCAPEQAAAELLGEILTAHAQRQAAPPPPSARVALHRVK